MNLQRIEIALDTLYQDCTVVFWHDVDSEFSTSIDELQMDGVKVVRLDDSPALRVKIQIEGRSLQISDLIR